ncbi:3-oxoacyl-ACP synthase, partial [Burkholderia pseudomultivorans]|nr:3-oxoacyl-ACP synthase [Burkholderia pseudomultivorans]
MPVERDTDLSGLAAKMALAICAARPVNAAPIDIAMFCHSSLNEHVSTTTAGRLRAVINTPCFAFSVSQ